MNPYNPQLPEITSVEMKTKGLLDNSRNSKTQCAIKHSLKLWCIEVIIRLSTKCSWNPITVSWWGNSCFSLLLWWWQHYSEHSQASRMILDSCHWVLPIHIQNPEQHNYRSHVVCTRQVFFKYRENMNYSHFPFVF